MPRPSPVAGRRYPRSYGDVLAWFPDEEACLDHLDWLDAHLASRTDPASS